MTAEQQKRFDAACKVMGYCHRAIPGLFIADSQMWLANNVQEFDVSYNDTRVEYEQWRVIVNATKCIYAPTLLSVMVDAVLCVAEIMGASNAEI